MLYVRTDGYLELLFVKLYFDRVSIFYDLKSSFSVLPRYYINFLGIAQLFHYKAI